jgi:toxin FitB
VTYRLQYLLDTNVLSETRRARPDAGVLRFLDQVDASALYVSVLTLGELRKGVAAKRLSDPATAERLESWVEGLEQNFSDRILGIDLRVARIWGELSAARPRPVIDTLLAATAIRHSLTLVTRNTSDVEGTSATILNPWVTS